MQFSLHSPCAYERAAHGSREHRCRSPRDGRSCAPHRSTVAPRTRWPAPRTLLGAGVCCGVRRGVGPRTIVGDAALPDGAAVDDAGDVMSAGGTCRSATARGAGVRVGTTAVRRGIGNTGLLQAAVRAAGPALRIAILGTHDSADRARATHEALTSGGYACGWAVGVGTRVCAGRRITNDASGLAAPRLVVAIAVHCAARVGRRHVATFGAIKGAAEGGRGQSGGATLAWVRVVRRAAARSREHATGNKRDHRRLPSHGSTVALCRTLIAGSASMGVR